MKILCIFLFLSLSIITLEEYSNAHYLVLNNDKSTIDGTTLTSSENNGVSILPGENIVHYESEYASLSGYGESTDESEWHSTEDCNKEYLIQITEAGTYIVSGTLKGQLAITIPEDEDNSDDRIVILVLNGVSITCNVAPGIIFYKANEIDETEYEDNNINIEYSVAANLDFSKAGAQIIIADDSENIVTGSHVAKCYKYTKYDNGTLVFTTKKRAKYDGAFYSKVSMLVTAETNGNGILKIIGDNEGLDSEKHLLIKKGNIYIASDDDGINTSEDGGSVTLISGGKVVINAGLGTEGDGIDSNGYLIVSGGEVISAAKPISDSGMDADLGVVINGGTSVAVGTSMDSASTQSSQPTMNLQFSSQVQSTQTLTVKDSEGTTLISFNPSKAGFIGSDIRGYSGAVISHPSFKLNSVYYIYLDDDQLGYGGQGGQNNGPGGDNNGGQPPSGSGPSGSNQPPDNENSNRTFPSGQQPNANGTFPSGQPPNENGTFPSGQQPNANGTFPSGQPPNENGTFPSGQPPNENGTTGNEQQPGGQRPGGNGQQPGGSGQQQGGNGQQPGGNGQMPNGNGDSNSNSESTSNNNEFTLTSTSTTFSGVSKYTSSTTETETDKSNFISFSMIMILVYNIITIIYI